MAALVNQRVHGTNITESSARFQRISNVARHRVLIGKHRRNSALRPTGVGKVNRLFRQHNDITVGRRLNGSSKPRHASANDQHISEDLRQQRTAKRNQETAVVIDVHRDRHHPRQGLPRNSTNNALAGSEHPHNTSSRACKPFRHAPYASSAFLPYTVPGPPFISVHTSSVSLSSCRVAPATFAAFV